MERVEFESTSVDTGSRFMAKVFGYMFGALLLTALVAVGVGYLFTNVWPIVDKSDVSASPYFSYYIAMMIASFVLIFITSIWFNISAWRGKHTLFVPFSIYAILMGILGSSFTMFINPGILGIAFGVTCLAFGSMALIGFLAKRGIGVLSMVMLGLLIGAGILSLFNLFLWIINPYSALLNYILVEALIFAVIMIITIIDVFNIKRIASRGGANNNVALYCAFSLYIDFINIFVRVLYVILLANSRR